MVVAGNFRASRFASASNPVDDVSSGFDGAERNLGVPPLSLQANQETPFPQQSL